MTHGKKGLSDAKSIKELIIAELLARETHQISQSNVTEDECGHTTRMQMKWMKSCMSFDQAGMIKTESIGNQIIYIMPDNQVQELKRLFAGKNR